MASRGKVRLLDSDCRRRVEDLLESNVASFSPQALLRTRAPRGQTLAPSSLSKVGSPNLDISETLLMSRTRVVRFPTILVSCALTLSASLLRAQPDIRARPIDPGDRLTPA